MRNTVYHPGGYLPAAPAQNRAKEWDSDAGTYTTWDTAGTVAETRALTAEEVQRFTEAIVAQAANMNRTTLRAQAAAAIATNTTDQAQAETIRAAADTLANTTGTFTTAQASTHIRSLATGVRLLAAHDIATKKQLNTLIRLVVEQLDSTDGT